jgi:hypothetical protein
VEDSPTSKRPPAGPRFPFQDWPVQLSTSFGYVRYTSPGVGNALLTVTTGRSIEIVAAISSALGKYGVERPSDERALTGLSA